LSPSWQSIYDRYGNSLGIGVSLDDISKWKQAEEKLRASNLKLSDQERFYQFVTGSIASGSQQIVLN